MRLVFPAPSEMTRTRVIAGHSVQFRWFYHEKIYANAQMATRRFRKHCVLTAECERNTEKRPDGARNSHLVRPTAAHPQRLGNAPNSCLTRATMPVFRRGALQRSVLYRFLRSITLRFRFTSIQRRHLNR